MYAELQCICRQCLLRVWKFAVSCCASACNVGLHPCRDVFKSKYLNVLDFVFGNTGGSIQLFHWEAQLSATAWAQQVLLQVATHNSSVHPFVATLCILCRLPLPARLLHISFCQVRLIMLYACLTMLLCSHFRHH